MATAPTDSAGTRSAEHLIEELVEANLDFEGFAQKHVKRVDGLINELATLAGDVRGALAKARTNLDAIDKKREEA
jgi:hypothetical protein